MQDCKPISTPFPTDVKLSSKMSPSSEKERMEMSRVSYASAVGSLMFAMICTRPGIAHAMGVVSRYMAEPGRGKWEAVKMVLRYIKGTLDVALCFRDSDLIVKGYVDSDYAVVAMSKTEAEYVAAAQASKEAVWLKMLLEELGHEQEKITLFCHNQSTLYLARNPAFHSKTKHIRVHGMLMKAIIRKDKCLAAIGERPAELTSLSCIIEPQERAEILLQSLPDLYDQVIVNLTSNVLSDYLVFDDVEAAILEEENRRNNREDKQTSSR
ncbi:hypothetical protein Tco_1128779 [Tanacetum coccineum]